MHINIREGLDIALQGQACTGEIQTLTPHLVAVQLAPLAGKKGLHLLVKEGDQVLLGSPIAEDKEFPDSKVVAVASGQVHAIVRGAKRSLEAVVIACDDSLQAEPASPLQSASIEREQLLIELQKRGLFNHIRQRPFNSVATPTKKPSSIFVKALESAPFTPQPDLQIQEHASAFAAGLEFLKKLTDGPVYLVHRQDSCKAIIEAQGVKHVTIEGPHPIANPSVHIHHLEPIESLQDCRWTLSAFDVLVIGKTLTSGRYFSERIVAIAGEGIVESKRKLVRTLAGASVRELLAGRLQDPNARIIAGDPLMGRSMGIGSLAQGYLDRADSCLCTLASCDERKFLHFMRLGADTYSASGAYLSSHLKPRPRAFTTKLHGEERAFIDAEPYQRVMPMQIPVMHLLKAVICEDFDKAVVLGLLEVDAEDFALPCFVCPSKIEMVDIMARALHRWSLEMQ